MKISTMQPHVDAAIVWALTNNGNQSKCKDIPFLNGSDACAKYCQLIKIQFEPRGRQLWR